MEMETPEMIVRYVDEEMDADERLQMEAAIAADAGLAERVALYREMKAALAVRLAGDAERGELMKTLGGMRGRYFGAGDAGLGTAGLGDGGVVRRMGDQRRGRLVVLRRWVAGVAVAASLLIAVTLLWPGRDNYLEKYGGAQMVSGVERGEGNDSLLNAAAAVFNEGAFARVLPLLDRVIASDSANQEALFYRGVAGLHTGGVDVARKDLERVYAGESIYRYDAAFYLALGYAERKDMVTAKIWLDRIPADAPGADKAKALRSKIE